MDKSGEPRNQYCVRIRSVGRVILNLSQELKPQYRCSDVVRSMWLLSHALHSAAHSHLESRDEPYFPVRTPVAKESQFLVGRKNKSHNIQVAAPSKDHIFQISRNL